MDALNKYKSDLELLKTKKAQVQVKIEQAQKSAAELKQQLKDLGYESLQAAKDDYTRRMGDIEEKDRQVVDLLHQIETAEAAIPTKEEILSTMRASLSKSVTVVEDSGKEEETQNGSLGEQDISVPEASGAGQPTRGEIFYDDDMFEDFGDLDL